ncbi:SDR family NAD(P)-dependent oxidoreductase [Chitinophaga oryzae]|uniref:SDR family NAD(P)-dependent oxidoreductase n=1 Tax=Chitinophaga oryzae TaxID=2725414 RepID=A0AAE7D7E1_9BACT|nr:type I polyketide synthase [Chitinophaga oryzae]QJB31619.1 SDR family NAD(P)-dependent oxidoreductase [Chitinophaga oryzae]
MKHNQPYTGLEIAIIGMACRFPGASCWQEFWHNLTNGVESVRFYTDEDLAAAGVAPEDIARPDFVKADAVLEHKTRFDAAFFGYRPEEASILNPMHRIFHECVWEALEDAGYDPATVKSGIGLYAGGGNDLNWQVYSMLQQNNREVDSFTLSQLNNKDYLSALLSYKLNLRGPAFTVNTACSTSLVAINLACKSLLMGETGMALAGGVSLNTRQQKGYFYQEGMIDSRDGHCRAFDALASGAVGGEGAGVVVLKRLQDAVRDRDHIYAVIKGSAINNDGNRKVGFTAPSIEGQADCIRRALAMADTAPSGISYVEAHGTGTRLGDPIEVEALNTAFNRDRSHACALGSVKTNIGHLDTAAGVAGLIKTALSLKFKMLPPSLHFQSPNPEIDFEGGPFYVNARLQPWPAAGDTPRRAGVSSFGIGGTNAHAVLEEAPAATTAAEGRPWKLFTVSARTPGSVCRYLEKIKAFLQQETVPALADMSFTLQTGRRHFPYRYAFAYQHQEDLLHQLDNIPAEAAIRQTAANKPLTVFMFPGQGSQYNGMAQTLYEQEPFIKDILDRGFGIVRQLTGKSLQEVWFAASGAEINRTVYAQPAIFLLEYAMTKQLMAWGVQPDYMIGHSIGELVAACVSGVFSFEDALKIVVKRAALMDRLPAGSMISVSLSRQEADALLNEHVCLAAVNAPEQLVLSGPPDAMQEVTAQLERSGTPHVRLHTSHAFHSAMLDPVLAEFRAALDGITPGEIKIPFVSNVTGEWITAAEATSPEYWSRHMRETVQLAAGIQTIMATSTDICFIEAGAGHILSGLLKQQLSGDTHIVTVPLIRAAREHVPDGQMLASAITQLWMNGISIDWECYYRDETRRRVPLPVYAFEQTTYPVEVDPFKLGNRYLSAPKKTGWHHWIYYPVWKSSILLPVTGKIKSFLFLSGGTAWETSLVRQLCAAGHEVIQVVADTAFRQVDGKMYFMDPVDKGQFGLLSAALLQQGVHFTDILYGLTAGATDEALVLEAQNRTIHQCYFALAHLVQALQAGGQLNNTHVFLLTDHLFNIHHTENSRYSQALAVGLLNALPQELPVSSSHIDIDSHATLAGLVLELGQASHQERTVAWRGHSRWVSIYQQNETPSPQRQPVKKNGVYLVTGGLGKVGFLLARHLVGTCQAKVVLTGRRDVEHAGENDEWNIRLKQLQAMGTAVYYRCDAADYDAFETMVSHIKATLGPVLGVIHAAGNIDRRYFELTEDVSVENTLAVLRPKVDGIRNLARVFEKESPDFVWITSSLASVLGGIGFGAYAAANLFMDHYVSSRLQQHPSWKCIGLSEMALDAAEEAAEARRERKALLPAELIALFEWSAGTPGIPVIWQTAQDLGERLHNTYHAPREAAAILPGEAAVAAIQQRPALSTVFVPAATSTEQILSQIMEQYFGFTGIGVDDDFFELGGDSLKAMILLKRIRLALDVQITVHDFFEARTIRQLATGIDNRLWLLAGENPENAFISII